MSWQFVFKQVDCTFPTINDAAIYAYNGGYRFLEWDGDVYFVIYNPNIHIVKTEIKSGDLV